MSQIKKIYSESVEFQHQNKTFVWALWFSVGIFWTLLAWLGLTAQSFLAGILAALVTGYTALWVCADRWKKLTDRINATEPEIWSVAVNGVRAGDISDADYARILRSVDFDLRTHLSQMLHFITRLYRIFTHMVLAVPIVVFWAAVMYWLSSPTDFASTLDSLKAVTSVDVQASIPTLVSLFGIPMALCAFGWQIFCGGFSYSKFDDAIAGEVLQSIGCPATGRVTLSQFRLGAVGDKFEFVN